MSLLELDQLEKSYGSVEALRGLSLSVPAGCLYGLLGPNGAGKTTALRILATLLAPDCGTVTVAGINALDNPRAVRQLMGFVAQEVAIDKILTGRELLALQGDLYHLPRAERNQRIEALIDRLSMTEWIDRRCGTYSSGMRRPRAGRRTVARALLFWMNQKTDIEGRAVIWRYCPFMLVDGVARSHYLEEVDAHDRMAIIDAGRVIAEGSPESLKQELGGDRVTLRVREFSDQPEAERVRHLLEGLDGVRRIVVNRAQGYSLNLVVDGEHVLSVLKTQLRADLEVFSLSQSRPSLDDVYLQATGRTLMDAELAVAGQRDPKLERRQSMR